MDRDRSSLPGGREPNPLRPYYIPPSIGHTNFTPSAQPATHGPKSGGSRTAPSASLSDAARDLLPDIDLNLKSTTSEAWHNTRSLLDTLAWRYTSVLLAQPFDVSKTLLQVSYPNAAQPPSTPQRNRPSRKASHHGASYYGDSDDQTEDSYDDEDDDIPDYFSASAPRSRSPRKRRRTPPEDDFASSPTPRPRNRREQGHAEQELIVKLKEPNSILGAISALYNTSGAIGLWRATNTTFLYAILLRTTDSFIRSLLLAILGLPEIIGPDQGGLAPGLSTAGGAGFSGIDLSDSPNPLGSLIVIGLSSCLTGILLAPLDLVRTRLLLTPMSHAPRGLVSNLRRLPSLLVPSTLWLPTGLYHSVPSLFSALAPLFLRRQLRITPELTPGPWSLAAFVTSLTELFVRLPLETIVRRAQLAEIQRSQPQIPLIVSPAPYNGVWGTVYSILYVEGETRTKAANGMIRSRRGQGLSGLVRGWRVGFWGLLGVWGAGALGPGDARKSEF